MKLNSQKYSIGIFDSGVGGLSVLKTIIQELPQYDYVYFGDNANVPYGNRTKKEIRSLVVKAVKFLFKKNCSLIILACNTATANALRYIQRHVISKGFENRRVLGVIRPVTEYISRFPEAKIGIVATASTVKSRSFLKEIRKLLKSSKLYQRSCPLLVPLIENEQHNENNLIPVLLKYLLPLKKKRVTHLVLGCTHYSLIKSLITKIMGKDVNVVSEDKIIALKLKDYLQRHPELEKKLKKSAKRTYYVSKPSDEYKKLMRFFLGKNPRAVMKLNKALL